jgi:hypothetical protein
MGKRAEATGLRGVNVPYRHWEGKFLVSRFVNAHYAFTVRLPSSLCELPLVESLGETPVAFLKLEARKAPFNTTIVDHHRLLL